MCISGLLCLVYLTEPCALKHNYLSFLCCVCCELGLAIFVRKKRADTVVCPILFFNFISNLLHHTRQRPYGCCCAVPQRVFLQEFLDVAEGDFVEEFQVVGDGKVFAAVDPVAAEG